MGCRERARGSLNIPGYRPAGIYSAGTAQRLVNMEGYLPGREVVILGSGDIGLIMARRMTLEGAEVKVVAELMPYSGGLKRNIVQCLDDFGIPLKLSHTVVDIKGRERLEGITLARVENGKPIPGTEEFYECDTLLLSCGLIPENELSRAAGVDINPITNGPAVNESLETSVPGVFAAGNVLHVHDLVDYVSEEAAAAGRHAAAYILEGKQVEGKTLPIKGVDGVRYTVPVAIRPAAIDPEGTVTIRFRVGNVYTNKRIVVYAGDKAIFSRKRNVLAPGEMETVNLKSKVLLDCPEADSITVKLEDA
jgi:NADPH-dependent 2,4-dienoyl-CoA reductase/sulfur reductase-like enzyme